MNIDYSRLGHRSRGPAAAFFPSLLSSLSPFSSARASSISGVAKINFTRLRSRFIRKTIMIKIGFPRSDSFPFFSFQSARNQASRVKNIISKSNGHFSTLSLPRMHRNFNLRKRSTLTRGAKTIEEINKMSNPYLDSFRAPFYS
jgi:hypothetical protein